MATFNELVNVYISSSVDIETHKNALFEANRTKTSTKTELKNKILEINISGSGPIQSDFLKQGTNYVTRNGLGFEIQFESRSMNEGGSYITELRIYESTDNINIISFD